MDYNTGNEVWKDVVGYEGLYKVSNCGRVWSCRRNKLRKQQITKGYKMVNLKVDGKSKVFSVHRLVALAFIENPNNKREVNHIDENKTNNHISNLEWVTSKENSNWGNRNKKISEFVTANPVKKTRNGKVVSSRKIKQIDMITGEVIRVYDSVTEASKINGYHQGNISSCCTGKSKSSMGFKWEYND